jgi:hypothetical protein
MAMFRLDFEEWHELFLAAQMVPVEERRPCLNTAILGIATLIAQYHVAHPDETTPVLQSGAHDCASAECQKALDAAAAMIQAGGDPFMVSVDDDPHGDRLDEINGRLVAIQAFLEDEDKS